jgi:hypothetical protein
MGLKLKMNTSFRPQRDGKIEKNELGYPTILKELCGNESIRLGGPFGVGQILIQ